MKEEIRHILLSCGAEAVGFAKAEPVSQDAMRGFDHWVGQNKHAGMEYMARHRELREDPRTLLDGTQTVISLAFSFVPKRFRDDSQEMIACYAYGRDYHKVIRKLLKKAVSEIRARFGGEFRICIDSAPVMERYWAVKSGVGFRGCNGTVITTGAGSMCFLAEILTTLTLSPDTSHSDRCQQCGKCLETCPGHAITEAGEIDSRRCLSYLTIEHKGPYTSHEAFATMSTPTGKRTLFGCDICLRTCPHNRNLTPSAIEDFSLTPLTETLSSSSLADLDDDKIRDLLAGTPLLRADWSRLK